MSVFHKGPGIFFALFAFFALLTPFSAQAVEVERVVSPGGIEAWLVQDHTNRVIAMRFAFDGGAAQDPAQKAGLSNLAADTMDEGAGKLDSKSFQQRLADQAIELGFDAGLDHFSGVVKTRTKTSAQAFELLRLALTQPRFDAEPLARIKSQILVGIRNDSENPQKLAYSELFKGFYPAHGYARHSDGTQETVKAITADDLAMFVKTRLGRDTLHIGVVGDITPKRLAKVLDETFGALPKKSQRDTQADIKAHATGRLKVIDKALAQSFIAFAQRGPKRNDPDFYAALVMNYILGGGSFTSHLYTEVREKRSLAYSVGSSLYPLKLSGLIVGSAGTRNARVADTVKIIRQVWKRMAAGDVTAKEVRGAKTYLTGSFPLRFTSDDAVARVLVAMQVNDLGLKYLDTRSALIDKVSVADVKRVAAKYLNEKKLDIVVVGRPKGVVSTP